MLESRNPADGEVLQTFAWMSEGEASSVLDQAVTAQRRWRDQPVEERAAALLRLAEQLDAAAEDAARLAVREMGKPITQARAELAKCVNLCRHYAATAAEGLSPRSIATEAAASMVLHQPLGVILGLMPWNYPFWQVFRSAVPILVAGNGYLLRHAENVTLCAERLAEIVRDAGLPPGLLGLIRTPREQTDRWIGDRRIAGVTLTGSVAAGRVIGTSAGRHLKPCVLELGGSDPFLVLADADVESAVNTAVTARMQNNGQSCIAAKRFLVERSIADAFLARFEKGLAALTAGDPLDEATEIGPLARADLRDTLHDQVTRSIADGAVCRQGGRIPDGRGFFYPPTLLTEVRPGQPAFDEELFGPVAAVTVVNDADEAIGLANTSRFGLGASVWTADLDRGRAVAARIESGMVFVNSLTQSDPRVPFGGIKESGVGRELSLEGLTSFTNTKTVWIEAS